MIDAGFSGFRACDVDYILLCYRLRGVLPTATQQQSASGFQASDSTPCRDKLRYLIEALLSVLVNRPNKEGIPNDLYSTVSADRAKQLFLNLCIHGSRRIQLLSGKLQPMFTFAQVL